MDDPDIVYETDMHQLTSIAHGARLGGLCFALTMRWLGVKLRGGITTNPTFSELRIMASIQLFYDALQGTSKELTGTSFIYGRKYRGDFGDDSAFDNVPAGGRAYVLCFFDSYGAGHRIGIFSDIFLISVYDQNIGEIVFTRGNIREVVRVMVGPTNAFRNTTFAQFQGYSLARDGGGQLEYSEWS